MLNYQRVNSAKKGGSPKIIRSCRPLIDTMAAILVAFHCG